MLSPRDDDDDDSHLCIRCNATLTGLDTYIKHRKERCGKLKSQKSELPLDQLEPSYSLGADVFFQSLELQSSVKKTALARLTPPITAASKPEPRPPLALVAARDAPRMSPLETNLRGEDWIGGHSLRISCGEADNQTKLINAVASISGAVKKEVQSTAYGIGPYNDDDNESEDASEDSEDEEDDEPPTTGGKWKPPTNYTGGKWRPDSPENEDWITQGNEQEPTGGKWKPIMPNDAQSLANEERDEDYNAPPPGHTKGKWVPGTQEVRTQIMQTMVQVKSSVQYWCGPCHRRLGSKTIYEKHLLSNLHRKRVLPENDLEFSGHVDVASEKIPTKLSKRTIKPSLYTDGSIYEGLEKKPKAEVKEGKTGRKKRKRKPYYVHCAGCKSRVRAHLMGKHLISHYHCRKAPAIHDELYQQLIIDNITAIVRQSPFQCSPCKFHANWLSHFMTHWRSEDHERRLASMEGRLWCSFCKFECDSSQDMLEHITGADHSEVIAVINRSMPIIIRKKSVILCKSCGAEFRYNAEVRRHCAAAGHQLPDSAADPYQELHQCLLCQRKFKTSLTLAAHIKSKHKQKAYLCLVCSLSFATSQEVKAHRSSSDHRTRRQELLHERGVGTKDLRRKCPHCKEVMRNLIVLKDHIRLSHPDKRKKCSQCGMLFLLHQEVTRHVRAGACRPAPPAPAAPGAPPATELWSCSQCLFTTDSQAECFYHEVLHSPPPAGAAGAYPCPVCGRRFRKSSLRLHLRRHTAERPLRCGCGARFTRDTSLSNHRRHCSSKTPEDSPSCEEPQPITIEKEILKCPAQECTFEAVSRYQLIRHRKDSHSEQVYRHECQLCDFSTDQTSHMKRHLRCHLGQKPFRCPHCDFRCASWENLRKHVINNRKHSGLFLYNCPDCGAYSTNKATDMRAHFTGQHGDKYPCTKSTTTAVKNLLMK